MPPLSSNCRDLGTSPFCIPCTTPKLYVCMMETPVHDTQSHQQSKQFSFLFRILHLVTHPTQAHFHHRHAEPQPNHTHCVMRNTSNKPEASVSARIPTVKCSHCEPSTRVSSDCVPHKHEPSSFGPNTYALAQKQVQNHVKDKGHSRKQKGGRRSQTRDKDADRERMITSQIKRK